MKTPKTARKLKAPPPKDQSSAYGQALATWGAWDRIVGPMVDRMADHLAGIRKATPTAGLTDEEIVRVLVLLTDAARVVENAGATVSTAINRTHAP